MTVSADSLGKTFHSTVGHLSLFLWAFFILGGEPARARQETEATLRLDSVRLQRGRRSLNAVTVKIQNLTSAQQAGVVWYVLSVPEVAEPWQNYVYASEEREITLGPGETKELTLPGPNVALDGEFAASVWLHGVRPDTGERFHSDSWGSPETVVIAPAFSFEVDYFETPSDSEGGVAILVRFSVRNNKTQRAQVGFLYRIGAAGDETPPEPTSFARSAGIAPGVSYVVTVRHEKDLAPGQYQLTGWLYELLSGRYRYRATSSMPLEVDAK
jgi:hypothetical protein